MVATTMSSLFVALFHLVASGFRTRAGLPAEILALRHQLAVSKRMRRVICTSPAATDSCGLCCRDCGPVGGDVCRWFSPTVLRWHRRALAWHWTRESRRLPGTPEVASTTHSSWV